jgi:hypothetical protein
MSRGGEHHHAAEAIRVMEQLFLLWTISKLDLLTTPHGKGPGAWLPGPFYSLRVFSDDQAGSRDHDPCDKGGLTREQQRFGEDSGHVAPRM